MERKQQAQGAQHPMNDQNVASTGNSGNTPRTIPDAEDLNALWVDTKLGDGITTTSFHDVAVGKPKSFFRTHPNADYRRRTEIYNFKPEGSIDEQWFIIAPSMRGRIIEARPCTLVTVIYRDGSPRLWPIPFPREGERDNAAWMSARAAARAAMDRWVKLLWVRRAYTTRDALSGYAPDPDWAKLPAFNDLVQVAFGEHGIIKDTAHPIYRELQGAPASADDGLSGDEDGAEDI
jgi:hypothetical protein